MRSLTVWLSAFALVGCADAETPAEPTAHLRQAARTCADAQPRLDRSGAGIVDANQAYETTGSRKDLATIRRVWDDVRYTMSSVGAELRAAAKPGLDPDYDRFVAAWERTTAQADRLVDVIEREDPQLVERSFRDLQARGRELHQAARTARVERCQAPLSPGGRTSGA